MPRDAAAPLGSRLTFRASPRASYRRLTESPLVISVTQACEWQQSGDDADTGAPRQHLHQSEQLAFSKHHESRYGF